MTRGGGYGGVWDGRDGYERGGREALTGEWGRGASNGKGTLEF